MALYKEFADIKGAGKLNLPRPSLKGGKNTVIAVDATPEQKGYVQYLADRAMALEKGGVDPHEDNYLKITGEARLIGLGNEAVRALYAKKGKLPDGFARGEKSGKIDACVRRVYEIWQRTKESKSAQIVFCDIAVNAEEGNFSAYDYIRDELTALGIPAGEIVYGPKADSKDREAIFDGINSGQYRVAIASTETLGTGANIQKKLAAMHRLDIPWKPSDFEQSEGRILRQGNENPEVEIFNYITKGTADDYLYSIVTRKARFIAQTLDSDAPARVCEDVDEKVLTYAEIQAIAAGDPDIRERIEKQNRVAELTMLRREWAYEAARTREFIEAYPAALAALKDKLAQTEADAARAEAITRLPWSNEELLAIASQTAKAFKDGSATPQTVGTVNGFTVTAAASAAIAGGATVRFAAQGEQSYSCEAHIAEGARNAQRLANLFADAIPKRAEEIRNEISKLTENYGQAQAQKGRPFEHDEELQGLTKRLEELDGKLAGISGQKEEYADPEETENPYAETREERVAREELYDTDGNDYQPARDGHPNARKR
jgi:hypothetical protein